MARANCVHTGRLHDLQLPLRRPAIHGRPQCTEIGMIAHALNLAMLAIQQEALLAEVADVIIPTTGTPGAKAAGAEKFIVRVMRDCYPMEEQKKFYDGLAKVKVLAKETYSKEFAALDADFEHRNDVLDDALRTMVAAWSGDEVDGGATTPRSAIRTSTSVRW